MKSTGKNPLKMKVDFEGKPKDQLQLNAYVFNSKGEMIQKSVLEKNNALLDLTEKDLKHSRIFIAPPSENEKQEEKPSLMAMYKRYAYEPVIQTGKRGVIEISPIPKFNWERWCWVACRVRGRVVKPIPVNGSQVNMPVCHARVHICEVDKLPFLLPLIPDDIIIDIRDLIINPPLPDPIPKPFPGPDPLPYTFNQQFELDEFKSLEPSVIKEFQADSPMIIREALLNNFQTLRPYLCLIPRFWEYLYRCDQLLTVITDHQGRFDTTIFYPCGGDKADLYFWVEYKIEGSWTTVYKPSIPCNTYWNYRCGSEVVITVKDKRVDVCGELPGPEGSDSVEIVKIGNSAYTSHIMQNVNADAWVQGELLKTVGLSDLGLNPAEYRRPFGATLGFKVHFGSNYPNPGGVTHYRWSYRRVKDADLSDNLEDWKIINTPAYIRYYEEDGQNFNRKAYALGPDPAFAETAYKIPPRRAEDLDTPNPRNLDRSWVLEEWNSAIVNTLFSGVNAIHRREDAGLYEFKFELLEKDGNGFRVATIDKEDFQMPDFNQPEVSRNAPDINLILTPGNQASAFVLKLRIDNNLCEANIHAAKVNGQVANDCGFVEYQNANLNQATISFKAFHPNNFANLSFRMRRGNQRDINGRPVYVEQSSGMVIGNSSNGYNKVSPGEFEKNIRVGDLLGLGACTDAAFAQYLYVDGLATNGSTSELGYDASSLVGFALKKS